MNNSNGLPLVKNIKSINNVEDFRSFINELSPTVGTFGGRFFVQKDGNKKTCYSMNKIVCAFDKISKTNEPKEMDVDVIENIRALDKSGTGVLKKKKYCY